MRFVPAVNALIAKALAGFSASAVWGAITGTLSTQADLQTALNLKLDSASYTAADVLTKIKTVDGAGSGLDADLLDGSSSAAFSAASHTHPESDVTNLVSDLALKAPLASPTFTGTVTTPGTLVVGAGSASANSWPKMTAGTILTTPEVGAKELDANCYYLTTDAGNRGYVPIRHFCRADATRTFTSNTNQQAIFTTPANGTLTLETGTYLFEGLIAMTSTSATSGNGKFSIIGAGGATIAAILWQAWGIDEVAEGVAAAQGGGWHTIATQTAANIVTASIVQSTCFALKGTFEVTGAGTIIPSFAQTTAAAAIVSIGSYIAFERIGSTTVTSVGQWT